MPHAAKARAADPPPRLVAWLMDWGERVFVVLLFAAFALSVAAAVGHGATWYNFALVASEGINAGLILVRRRTANVSDRPVDWIVALAATAGSLLVRPGGAGPIMISLAGTMILAGLIGQVWSKLALGRSFGVTAAHRGLKVAGPYAWVRHPIYLSYLMGWIGFLMLNPTTWNASVYAVLLVCQVARMNAEERLLSHDPAFAAYAAQVRYRLVPLLY